MENYFEIGKITGTHALKGTFRVYPTTQDAKRFEQLKTIIIEHNGKKETYHVQKVSYQKKFVLLTTKEITDINVAELYKNDRILIPDTQAIPLEEDEYYTRDLFGMEVVTTEGELLGELVKVYETGANDVYGIQKTPEEKELLIPAIKSCIQKVDLKEKKMTVVLLKGLRD